jgi:zinc protease
MTRRLRGPFVWALIVSTSLLSCVGSPEPASLENASVQLPGGSAYTPADPLPLAPELTKKTLPNGLTYYVRRNGNPGGRAVMFLIVNSGSSNERDDQSGYAHFVEHMAFNGTASFPENELVKYLRSIGMDFGAEINAHTTREETLYTLQMPLNDPSFFDTGLKVLKEWATAVTFDPVEVVRLGLGPDETARVKEVGGLLAGTAHDDREPIGYQGSIKEATAAGLKDFYDEHYRPDRMAVIVVGDIDPRTVAAKIEKEFSFPAADGEVRPRPSLPVQPSVDLGFVASFDDNFERSIVTYRKIVPYVPETRIGDYGALLRTRIAAEAIRMRLSDLSSSGGSAWRDAYFDDDYFYGLTRLYSFSISAADGKELEAFSGLASEVERIRRFGFTDSEFRRTVDLYRRWVGTLDVEDDDLKSFSFAEEYVRNFMYGEPVPGIINERVYIREVLDTLTLDALNEAGREILAADEGFVAVRAKTGPGNAALTESAFEKTLRDARTAALEPIAATAASGGLFDAMPQPGTIVSDKLLRDNITELYLSNGARVLLKPTSYDKDAISFLAWSDGGYSSLPVEMQTVASFAPTLMSAAGLGPMSATRLAEESAHLNAGLQWSIGENGEVLVGKTATADLESFLRLVYLTAAEPGRDARAFDAARDRLAEQIGPYVRDPAYRFESAWSLDLFGDNPRAAPLAAAAFLKVDFESTRRVRIYLCPRRGLRSRVDEAPGRQAHRRDPGRNGRRAPLAVAADR